MDTPVTPTARRGTSRATAFLAAAVPVATTMIAVAAVSPAAAAPTDRPDFRLPVTCAERWRLQTYAGHSPDDKKLDLYNAGGATLGAAARASAPGVVHQQFDPGGLEIDHGNGWFTVYLHMSARAAVGTRVAQGQWIGTVGSVGTSAAHLHYEQLYDSNGDGDGETDEMVHPVIQGVEYRLSPTATFPVVTSTNTCRDDAPTPTGNFSTWGSGVRVRQSPSTSAAVVTTFTGPTRVQVQCQRRAESVTAEGYTNDAWSRITSPVTGWISNIYVNDPAEWLPGIPTC